MTPKAISQHEEFEKAIAKFTEEWLGYEIQETHYANFSMSGQPTSPGTSPGVMISLHLGAVFHPKTPAREK